LYDSVSEPLNCGVKIEYYDFAPTPAACAACSCSSLDKSDCQNPVATYYSDQNCQTPCGHAPLPTGGVGATCVSPACGTSFTVANATFGACTPSGGDASVKSPFVLRAQACSTPPS